MSEAGDEAEAGDGRVEIQSGGETDGSQQGEKFALRDLQEVGHRPGRKTKGSLPMIRKRP
jgi:hypothetical protein